MEKHKCKLCSRCFSNGRALGGHMKAHLATSPLPPKTPQESYTVGDDGVSSVVVIQDRESETESKKPTKRRSKRSRKPLTFESKKLKLKLETSSVESPEQPLSSVSDTSADENVAMCLMMLSRDVRSTSSDQDQERSMELDEESKIVSINKLQCEKCNNKFRSLLALTSHKKICSLNGNNNVSVVVRSSEDRIFKCPYCLKIFGSGQALGGHKRSHLICSTTSPTHAFLGSLKVKVVNNLIDLNMPAPVEDDEFSVVLDA